MNQAMQGPSYGNLLSVGEDTIANRSVMFNDRESFIQQAHANIRETEVVLDIGCGIAPMNFFRPKLHILAEPWKEYSDILSYRHANDKSVLIWRAGALEALEQLADQSIDSIFLLDVIEHMEKDVGQKVIENCERVAREQVIIFTPLGFMPQHMDKNETDGWGLNGTEVQEHRSGWEPKDFGPDWNFYICPEFHDRDFNGAKLDTMYGAFYAICTLQPRAVGTPQTMCDIRRPLPSELQVQNLMKDLEETRKELHQLQAEFLALQNQYSILINSRGHRLINRLRTLRSLAGV